MRKLAQLKSFLATFIVLTRRVLIRVIPATVHCQWTHIFVVLYFQVLGLFKTDRRVFFAIFGWLNPRNNLFIGCLLLLHLWIVWRGKFWLSNVDARREWTCEATLRFWSLLLFNRLLICAASTIFLPLIRLVFWCFQTCFPSQRFVIFGRQLTLVLRLFWLLLESLPHSLHKLWSIFLLRRLVISIRTLLLLC